MASARLRAPSPGAPGAIADVHPQWTAVESALATQGEPLDTATRSELEPRFGVDFARVRVHAGDRARTAAGSIGAVAFTLGRHIVLGAPSVASAGRGLLAHELAHVALQRGAASTVDSPPTALSRPHEAGEVAAERAAHAVLAGRAAGLTAPPRPAGTVFRQVPAHDRGYAGEQGMGFAGYPSPTWALVEGPSGAAGHGVTTRGFDAVAVRVQGPFEIHLVDNKSLARAGNVSSATALTQNLSNNLDALITRVNGAQYNNFPRIAQVRTALAQARTALNTPGARLPASVQLIVTNVGGRSTGITAGLAARGVQFRDLNQIAPPTGGAPPTTGTPPTQTPPGPGPQGQGPAGQRPPGAGPGSAGPSGAGPSGAGPSVTGPAATRPGGAASPTSSLARPLAEHLGEQQRFTRRVLLLTKVVRAGAFVLQVIGELDTAVSMINMAQNGIAGRAFLLDPELARAERLATEATTLRTEYADYSGRLATWKFELIKLLGPRRELMVAAIFDSLSLLNDLDSLRTDLDTRISRLAALRRLTEAREQAAERLLSSGVLGSGATAATVFAAYTDLGRINGALSRASTALTAARDAVDKDRPFFPLYIRQAREWIDQVDARSTAPATTP